MEQNFAVACASLREGRTTFAEFGLATHERWVAMARWLMLRLSAPEWVELQDVVQDLLAGAWIAIWGYVPGRGGMALEQYVRVTAVASAKKALQRARGVDRHTCVGPSHIDLTFARLGEEGEAAVLNLARVEPGQHEALERKRRMREVCRSLEEVIVLQALDLERTFEGAARRVIGDEMACEILGVETEEQAAVAVVRAAYGLVRRIGVENAA